MFGINGSLVNKWKLLRNKVADNAGSVKLKVGGRGIRRDRLEGAAPGNEDLEFIL